MRLHHLAFRTRDVAALEAFYVEVFALEVRRRDGARSVWLGLGDAVCMIERADAHEPPPNAGSMELVALAVSDDAARDAVEARVLARGGAIEGRTGYTIYFRDPEGRRLGVSTYPLEPTR
ncbi:MAG: VOC family protein [Sandaracinus sp.]|nr:VOC family protein [Myxococcales bacterium]MCB9613510.1 VOC family protein [Sandaracinus sp.]MCB9619729.1 VOC family protein [Sandaracinus sp.]MCB9624022.1 VOC family protein [Sandaracinus sp.]MCB9635226.1 VOC family protein [Sandaracinus sp.]